MILDEDIGYELARQRRVDAGWMIPPIPYDTALHRLEDAYNMLAEFEEVINDQLEGDHYMWLQVKQWLEWYEKNDPVVALGPEIEGVPV